MFSFFQKNKKPENKKPHTANINGQTIEVNPQETLLNAALRHDIEFPHSCRVGGCAACKCQLRAGKVKELTDVGYILSDEDLDNGYILACQSVPETDISIRLDLPQQSIEHTAGKVIAQKRLTHDITELVVRTDTPVSYQPGQFADLTLASLPDLARSYSFASVPASPSNRSQNKENTLSFFVREVPSGRFSGAVNQKDLTGERIDIKGPLGDFWLRPAQNPIVMVAGGSGLAPVIAMLEAEVQQSRHRPLLLLFGARSQQDLYALERIDNIRRHWHASFEFTPVLSDEADTSNWNGKRGLVSDFIQPALLPESHAYLCGPPAMIDAAETVLKKLGISANHIYADRFITVDMQKAVDVKKSA
ncbi:2Fe-2S iron-sulfur cluster binding domain-containing protein [Bacterioplanoides sp. SCSIO 12839]|uniref:2Fe-2S iron-sulfur cluster-binding protein n=1 Tax=Bacterioplanoides sp. SCSIO 12839 TaxID=2829569 RepID=UPI0021047E9B|nr:2Fe-2S iron-sulfur cluster binding domain-containing protein [Bacterioplanoides sp. SCSIO 12839]UTW49587.1 2Fe-2S iron-sulfur cluster binding domain-containing protein [Bacterioplanoides sp. SCSIO 12839]